ncbi:hypothetical protein [Heyndrickxia vini]|uniref:Uncharacterized protein n=1 Tax=Heyndrickxia vini TaxID=1476025 RepID=A0ABX7DZ07_9BACI|nr:hypothetical protein [Heyndrickxia vini]QQZ08338.1 hypothetical protein I5776_14815 [Heyndrickxia vini]
MSASHYHTCQRNIGKPVEIRTHDGRVHRGIIRRVDNRMVYLDPLPRRNFGGYAYGWGWGWGGFGWGVALGAIAGLAILPWFFW